MRPPRTAWLVAPIALLTLISAFPGALGAPGAAFAAAPSPAPGAVAGPSVGHPAGPSWGDRAPPPGWGRFDAGLPTRAAPRPAIAGPEWYNTSAGMPAAEWSWGELPSETPPDLEAAAMATDPNSTDGPVSLMFGGDGPGFYVQDSTWLYYENSYAGPAFWVNVTNISDSPPALAWASMDFDPNIGAFVLFGGQTQTGLSDQTWLFNVSSGAWTNDTGVACTFFCPSPREASAMAFDPNPNDNVTVLFGGCFYYCEENLNDTWELEPFFGNWYWINVTGSIAPSPRFGATLAVTSDDGQQYLALFGGASDEGGQTFNDTWLFSEGNWFGLTRDGLSYGAPSGRAGATMSYDWELGETLMTGGYNASLGQLNDSWGLYCEFLACFWTNLTSTAGAVSALWSASSTDNWYTEPVVVGGYDETGLADTNTTFVFQNATSLMINVSDLTPEREQRVSFNASLTGGFLNQLFPDYATSLWWFQQPGGHSFYYYGNFTGAFPATGTWYANVTAFDAFDVGINASYVFAVGIPTAQARVAAATTDVNVPDAFTSAVGGDHTATGISYNWTFGDGGTATTQDASHAYATAGTHTAEVNITDGLDNSAYANVSVTVNPRPAASASATVTSVAVGSSVGFTGRVANGTGPFNYSWNFDDGSAKAYGPAPSHSFATGGSYTVTLTVTDAVGVTANATVAISVLGPLSATASANVTTAHVGSPIEFTASPSGGTPSYTITWRFGDGTGATGSPVSHAYAAAGDYTATVWVNDSKGDSVTRQVSVTITAPSSSSKSSSSGTVGGVPIWAWAVVAVVVLAAIVGGLLVARGRRRPPAGAPPPYVPPATMTGPAPGGPAAGVPPPGAGVAPPPWAEDSGPAAPPPK